MGLTIHYDIQAPKTWGPSKIRQQLEAARQFALDMPFVEVSDIKEFKDNECDFNWIRNNPTPELNEKNDDWFWAKIQAGRYISSPYKPGNSWGQAPNRMIAFRVYPAEGSEEMTIGICSYPKFTIKPQTKVEYLAWSQAQKGNANKAQTKVWKTFTKKYKLRKMKESKRGSYYDHPTRDYCYQIQGDCGWGQCFSATIVGGNYMSHRRGRAKDFGMVRFYDSMLRTDFCLKFMGTAEEAKTVFNSKEFQADVNDLVYGKEYTEQAEFGKWGSFCKTQYANDPRCGGFQNFQRAHLGVVAMMDKLIELGFKVHVSDEGDFWENRDIGKLAKEISSWDSFIAGFMGVFKDSIPANSEFGVESAMDGRPDFEQLEMQAYKIENVGEHLKKLRRVMDETNRQTSLFTNPDSAV